MKRYCDMKTLVDPELKELAMDALVESGVSVSDYLRSALIHLVEERSVPFKVRRAHHDIAYRPKQTALKEAQT